MKSVSLATRWTLCLMVCLALGACSVARQSHELTTPVDQDAEIFDKRFRQMEFSELNLESFWTQKEFVERDPVPLTNMTVADIVEGAREGVVNIYTQRLMERNTSFGISPNDLMPLRIPFLTDLFEIIPFKVPVPFKENGFSLGSGFIINSNGFILTNAHVILNATDIVVVLSEGKEEYPARIIGIDLVTDLALLKIEADRDLTSLPLGVSDELRTGETVLAMGNPLGFKHTVTSGLVSAKERVGPFSKGNVDFIQTDSAINPGSSGGPLLNMYGEVVGVNTAIIESAQLIGFAISADMVKEVLPMLLLGKTERGWFGVQAIPLRKEDMAALNLYSMHGIRVVQVAPGGPAEQAGLKENDVIVSVNGASLDNFVIFRRKLLGMSPGAKISLDILRAGKPMLIVGTLREAPKESDRSEGSAE
ncbi:MAG: trypsin-like serine protease [Candidatus Nitrohelix vancouverensis]|uniref:Trypsin-like serine protease n=1 Tax=Candidatus Nitrohelix vancouverensis TaxID=2705534 RepID=A0A7T0C1U8_9BACT|nr:MAG: trypsin-like serine protease [Candidatus Nitrohelix vancouverensis]